VPTPTRAAATSDGSRPVLFLTVFINLLGFGIIIPLLPYYAQTYGASGLAVGLLATSFSLMQFLFTPLWGRLSDRIGRRPVLIVSLVVTGLSYVIFATANSLWVLFVSRMLAGAAGAVLSTAQAYIADTTTPEQRTKGMGLIGAAFGIGFIFGPAIGGILSHWGFAVPAFTAAALAAIAAVFAFFRLRESLPREVRTQRRAEPRSDVTLIGALRRPRIGPVLVTFFVGTLCFAGMEAVLALFCQHAYGLGPNHLGYLFAFVGVVAATVQLRFVGGLAKRFGERRLARAGLFLIGAGFVGGGLAPPFPLFLVAMGAVAVGSGLSNPSLSGLVSIVTSPEEQGSILGFYQSLGSLARAVGPFLGGLTFDRVGPGAPLWLAGAVLGALVLYAARLPARDRATLDGDLDSPRLN